MSVYIFGTIIVAPNTIGSIVAACVKPPAAASITTSTGKSFDIKFVISTITSLAKSKDIINVFDKIIISNA